MQIFFQKIIFLSDNENYFKFTKALKGPFSKFLTYEYRYIKEFTKIRNFSLEKVKNEILKQKISETACKDRNKIEKAINLYINMQKYFMINPNSLEENQVKIELLGTVIFILRYEIKNNFDENELYRKLISWNQRKEKQYNLNDVIKIINFLEQEKIIKRNIFNKFEIIK